MIKALWYILIGRVDPGAVIKLAEGTHHLKRKVYRGMGKKHVEDIIAREIVHSFLPTRENEKTS